MRDFTGFRFGNFHSEDLHLVVVSSGNRYDKQILPQIKDYSAEVPGANGQNYFGSTFDTQEFTVEVAFDSVDEKTWRKISNIFATDELKDLVFDELPYKTYRAKVASKPSFKFICFTNDDGERVYKGEGTINFICYQPFAYGFNKYIVRAADNYLQEMPKPMPKSNSIEENPYKEEKEIPVPPTKEFYNVEKNMGVPWKGGYPTLNQVKAGELYFNSPDGLKLIDVRDYFKNVPEWAASSKLLVTPTLDFDQELIYLPQFCKTNFYNMDIGLHHENTMIGSRIMVYNPGDIPVDFKLTMNLNKRALGSSRQKDFRVRRFNVQRMPISMAVDLTGLKPFNPNDEEKYKYGDKYFNIATADIAGGEGEIVYNELKDKHPKHTYLVEPIPMDLLGDFIEMFYWQSSINHEDIDADAGYDLAKRYKEMLGACIDDYERYEVYWNTLIKFLSAYQGKLNEVAGNMQEFIYDFIHNPVDMLYEEEELDYGQVNFNIDHYPQWYTNDYIDISSKDFENNTVFLDTSKEMLYNIISSEFDKNDKSTYKNFYSKHHSKNILNDNIKKGHWFKIPPGWSLIEVAPVCTADEWGGKTWMDARPFYWGYSSLDTERTAIDKAFNKIFSNAAKQYKLITGRNDLLFRHWYEDQILAYKDSGNQFAYEYFKNLEIKAEYGFLKMLHSLWQTQRGRVVIENGEEYTIAGDINEWWWKASNYLWENFPPLYWAYADILNDAVIDYIPLFY